ncbi:MAG: response regulator, partial [Bacteroidota bacterium]
SLKREIKLEMYSSAVKEVIAKRKLLRNSSNTLEWLRKVYQVTMDEYLEYESKFLMDLVADQFKGTVLLVSSDKAVSGEMNSKLKSSGYAVVLAPNPESALEKIDKLNPHFIICDTQFPEVGLSGIRFLHVLRANSKFGHVPFILICAKGELASYESSELRATEGVVDKPVDFDALTAVMNEKTAEVRAYLASLSG